MSARPAGCGTPARYFWAPIPWMIEVALVLSLVVRLWTDAAVIGVLLVMNVAVAFTEEHQAANAIAALKQRLATTARVLRDGAWATVPARDLVPGDVIRVRLEGDAVVYATGPASFSGRTTALVKEAGTVSHFQRAVLRIAALASRAEDRDPIDLAILAAPPRREGQQVTRFVPFDPVTKRTEATVTADGQGPFKVGKGAPQAIAGLCAGDPAVAG